MLPNLDRWDAALLAIAAYLAVTALVRLMAARRDKLVTQFRAEVALERQRQIQIARQQQRDAAKKAGRGAA